jgi:hypothetical protein
VNSQVVDLQDGTASACRSCAHWYLTLGSR